MQPQQLELLLTVPTRRRHLGITFAREVILAGDCPEFLARFGNPQGYRRERLHELAGRVRFRFAGYPADGSGFEAVPELRQFLRDWHRAWPMWFFFADLGEPMARRMTLACLPNLQVVHRTGAATARVSFASQDLLRFLEPEWIFLRTLSANAGFTPAETAARAHEVWTYLGLPADQFPHALWPTQPEAAL